MIESKYAEIRDLVNKRIFRAVLRAELLYCANLITTKYFFSLKSDEGKEEQYGERYVPGGLLDIMKDYIVHGAQTIQ